MASTIAIEPYQGAPPIKVSPLVVTSPVMASPGASPSYYAYMPPSASNAQHAKHSIYCTAENKERNVKLATILEGIRKERESHTNAGHVVYVVMQDTSICAIFHTHKRAEEYVFAVNLGNCIEDYTQDGEYAASEPTAKDVIRTLSEYEAGTCNERFRIMTVYGIDLDKPVWYRYTRYGQIVLSNICANDKSMQRYTEKLSPKITKIITLSASINTAKACSH